MEEASHFERVRAENKRRIRNLMLGKKPIGKSELAELSGLTFPTVSALVNDLISSGEACLLEQTRTRGGRPAGQYMLSSLFRVGVCAYFAESTLYWRVVDVFGDTIQERRIPFPLSNCHGVLMETLRITASRYPTLDVLCLGIPGVVKDGKILFMPAYPEFHGRDLGAEIAAALNIQVFIENDVNTLVLAERHMWPSLFHLFESSACAGSGILIDGNLLRGAGGFAGEIEYLSFGDTGDPIGFTKRFQALKQLSDPHARKEAILHLVASAIVSVVCVINPADVAISGFELSLSDLRILEKEIFDALPGDRMPRLHFINDIENLYFNGLLGILSDYRMSL